MWKQHSDSCFSTSLPALDKLLRGGLPCGTITEVHQKNNHGSMTHTQRLARCAQKVPSDYCLNMALNASVTDHGPAGGSEEITEDSQSNRTLNRMR